jgi:2'-5' RNA ligase
MRGVPKARLGVALLLPAAVSTEVQGLRRALGDGALDRIPPHLTLVPPVNVREDRLPDALAVLRAAAAATEPLTLTLGPPATFLPYNPTVYLAVGGDLAGLHALRDRVFRDPLERPLTWPFVPHVTLADEIDSARIPPALEALADYRAEVTVDAVHLLQEGAGRTWAPIADVPFEVPRVIGRGGLPLELTVTEGLDPEAATLDPTARVAVTARRDGSVVGTATGAVAVDPAHTDEGIEEHLVTQLWHELRQHP